MHITTHIHITAMASEITTVCDSKFHAYAIIRYTFDYWSKNKHNTGYSLFSESHSISPLDYKPPWSYCWMMLYRPKAKTECYSEIVNMSVRRGMYCIILTSKTRYQSIVSFLSLYRLFLKLFSNNLLWWVLSIKY